MTVLKNEILINGSIDTIWELLSNVEVLANYDPTVQTSVATTEAKSGIDASRKVNMIDGKNWFEEKVTEWKPGEAVTYQLTACSFPVSSLKHSYSFDLVGEKVMVKQVMEYSVKYGFLGKVLDRLMMRKETSNGIKKFLSGLKSYVEE
jgi:ribosome-associated toxin RatA of RatAB toxin-antitoxin module